MDLDKLNIIRALAASVICDGPVVAKYLSGLPDLPHSGEQVAEAGGHAGACPVIGGEVKRRPTIRIANSTRIGAVLVLKGFDCSFISSDQCFCCWFWQQLSATQRFSLAHAIYCRRKRVDRNKWTGGMKHVFAFEFFCEWKRRPRCRWTSHCRVVP